MLRQLYLLQLREAYEGDLEEEYAEISGAQGRIRAWIWAWFEAVRSAPVFTVYYSRWSTAMLLHHLKTAFRNLKRKKTYSFINVTGLAIGLTVSVLILLYIKNELTYDHCHEKSRRVYRIVTALDVPNRHYETATTVGPIGPMLAESVPGVIDACRFRYSGRVIISYEDHLIREEGFCYTDPSITDIFTLRVIEGNTETFLDAPFSLLLTQEMARRIFGSADPMGKLIKIDNQHEYAVTGIIERLPENSHFKFNMLASMATLERIGAPYEKPDQWFGFNFHSYIEVLENTNPEDVIEKAMALVHENTAQFAEQLGVTIKLSLQPMRRIHLHSHLEGELEPPGNITMIRIFTTVALFILLIACINFMNLSTAQSVHRAREVGMRKVCGAFKRRLVWQFLGESILFCLISMVIAVLLILICLPVFNNLIEKNLAYRPLSDWTVTLGLLALAVIVGFISGSYPAFFLSSHLPVEVLKTRARAGKPHVLFRNVLVNLQYIISIALIFSTLVIMRQLHYVRTRELGFDKERVAVIALSGQAAQKFQVFKTEVLRLPGVEKASCSSNVPGWGRNETMFTFEGSESTKPLALPVTDVDEDYLKTMGIPLRFGRPFSSEYGGDQSGAMIVNQSLVQTAGWENPIGKQIFMTEINEAQEIIQVPYSIIGVVNDFHFESLHTPIRPHLMRMLSLRDEILDSTPGRLSVKIRAGQIPETLDGIRDIWASIEPARPFTYRFMDEVFTQHFAAEQRLSRIFLAFTGLAILIACLGLFGLACFTAEQRTKEIGIRKTLGASIPGVIALLSKEFTKWVFLANVAALPLAAFAMKKWLESFAYRIDLAAWIFVVSGAIALFIAWLTVSMQTLRAATANPVDTLRYE